MQPPPRAGQDPRPPPAVKGYTLLRKIGEGAFGVVWLAKNDLTRVYRAIKAVYHTGHEGHVLYDNELTGVIAYDRVCLGYDGFIRVLEVGRDEARGCFFYVMEIADNAEAASNTLLGDDSQLEPETYTPLTLKQRLINKSRQSPEEQRIFGLSSSDALNIAKSLAVTLATLHAHGLIHRDIKPSNVLFKRGAPKLADAGLVTKETKDLSPIGTEGYMPPEGTGNNSGDIYALGIVLYEMITGMDRKAFPSAPAQFDQSSPESLQLYRIAVKAGSPRKNDRYASASEMAQALDLVASANLVETFENRMRLVRRVGFSLFAFAVVAVLFGLLVSSRLKERRQRILSDLLVSRSQLLNNGWYTNFSRIISLVAGDAANEGIKAHKSSLLAGLDAEPIVLLPGLEASSAALALDGRLLFGGGSNTRTYLLETTNSPRELAVRGQGLVRFSHEGVPLHLGFATNSLELREADSGNIRRRFDFSDAPVLPGSTVIALSEDCRMVAAAHQTFLSVWTSLGLKNVTLPGPPITALAFSPDALFLAAGFRDGATRVYSLPDLSEITVLSPPGRGTPIFCLAFGRDPLVEKNERSEAGKWLLATGDQGAAIVIWDVIKSMPRAFCRGSTWIVSSIAFTPDGTLLASAGRNQPRIWDVSTGKPLLQLDGLISGPSLALAFDPSGTRLAIGGLAHGGNAMISLWQLQPDRGIKTLRGLSAPVRKVWFSLNGERVAALSDNWHVGIWDLETRNLISIFETTAGVFADNAGGTFDKNGDRFVFAAGTEAVSFDLRSLKVSRKWKLKSGLFDHVEFDADARILLARIEGAAATGRAVWRLYELVDDAEPMLRREQAEAYTAAGASLGPDGKWLAVWSSQPNGILRVYEALTGKEVWRSKYDETADSMRVCFDPVGTRFGYTLKEGKLRILELPGFRVMDDTAPGVEAVGPQGEKWCFRFGDGWKISSRMSESKDGLLLNTDFNRLRWVSKFSSDGNQLAWGTEEGLALVADLNEVEQRLSR